VASSHAIFSGAGIQHVKRRNVLESGQVSRVLSVGSVFGFVDFVLKRPRTFSVVAGKDARVAKCHRSGLDELKLENSELDRIIDRVLLLCSVLELATRDQF
jgi:CRP-like cAMP-binding protein